MRPTDVLQSADKIKSVFKDTRVYTTSESFVIGPVSVFDPCLSAFTVISFSRG